MHPIQGHAFIKTLGIDCSTHELTNVTEGKVIQSKVLKLNLDNIVDSQMANTPINNQGICQ